MLFFKKKNNFICSFKGMFEVRKYKDTISMEHLPAVCNFPGANECHRENYPKTPEQVRQNCPTYDGSVIRCDQKLCGQRGRQQQLLRSITSVWNKVILAAC